MGQYKIDYIMYVKIGIVIYYIFDYVESGVF